MDVSEGNVRIWMEYAHISVGDPVLEVDAIDGTLVNLSLLKEIIGDITKPKLVEGTQNEDRKKHRNVIQMHILKQETVKLSELAHLVKKYGNPDSDRKLREK